MLVASARIEIEKGPVKGFEYIEDEDDYIHKNSLHLKKVLSSSIF